MCIRDRVSTQSTGSHIFLSNIHLYKMVKVALLGAAGGIGQPLALLLKQQLPAGSHLALADIVNVTGVAVDLSHICTPVKVTSHLGADKLAEALTGADVVVIPAGVPRKPGMTRDDLFNVNAGIVRNLVEGVAVNCPNAWIAIITNPVNTTVPIAAEVLKKHGVFNPHKLFGVTTLDIVRSNTFVAELKSQDVTKVNVSVIGGHSGVTILPVLSQIPGVTFTEEEHTKLTKRIQDAGTEVVDAKQGAGSATLSMAFAAAKFVHSILTALTTDQHTTECAYVKVDGLETEYFAGPVVLGKDGIVEIKPIPQLNAQEQAQLKEVYHELKVNIQKGVDFVNKA
eukprot:TRINITY_DN798_c0_g1_i1.p1 TRINITY_DN798_c0_g1~~TRINITY_DN798_c0_g1_i1.p1  ORF type:complete len:340 (-),score=117.75 TRINITY_DN798_c0_g1_i1:59-1078(-)